MPEVAGGKDMNEWKERRREYEEILDRPAFCEHGVSDSEDCAACLGEARDRLMHEDYAYKDPAIKWFVAGLIAIVLFGLYILIRSILQ